MADAGVAYVYVLFREDGTTPFYVGKGRGKRWLDHEANAKRGRSYKDNIICAMKDSDVAVPKRKIAEGLTNDEANDLERSMIARIGRIFEGGPLTNLTAGGDGCPNLSPEARERHRINTGAAQLGKKHSAERRARLSAALKGKRCAPLPTAATTAKRCESLRQSWASMSPERREARGMAGKRHSAATIARMKRAATGRKMSDAARAKMSAAKTGRPWSEARRKAAGNHG